MVSFKEFLLESNLKDRASNRFTKIKDILAKLTQQGVPESNIWLTFTNVPRISIWPQSETRQQGTPTALFAYPLNFINHYGRKFEDFYYYGCDRAFMVIFIVNENINDIGGKTDFDISQYSLSKNYASVAKTVFRKITNTSDEEQECLSVIFSYIQNHTHGAVSPVPNVLQMAENAVDIALERVLFNAFDTLHGGDTIFGETIDRVYHSVEKFEPELYSELAGSEYKAELSAGVVLKIEKYPQFSHLVKYANKVILYGKELLDFDKQIRKSTASIDPSKIDKEELFNKTVTFIKECNSSFAEFIKQHNDVLNSKTFPKKDELIKIATEHQLDLNLAIINAARSVMPIENENQFVYRIAENLAMQWADKDDKHKYWPSRWARILKRLGISNIVDLQHTGAVHGSEPTQGAFFDTRKLEMVAVLVNRSHLDPRTVLVDKYNSGHLEPGGSQRKKTPTGWNYYNSPEEKKATGLAVYANQLFTQLASSIDYIKYFMVNPEVEIGKERASVKRLKNLVNRYVKIHDWIARNKPHLANEIRRSLQEIDLDSRKELSPILHRLDTCLNLDNI
jgi:hypothetical protein